MGLASAVAKSSANKKLTASVKVSREALARTIWFRR